MPSEYRALRVELHEDGARRSVTRVPFETLPDHDVTVRVRYSALNYKDALSASGNRGVTRAFPHTPGIDAAGEVVASRDPRYTPGQNVLCTGNDLGMNTPGGFAEFIRVPGDWLVPLPEPMDAREAMALGTAAFTAAIAVDRLASVGAGPELGPFVVTGASGGVGTMAVALLARAGYEVVASSGKADAEPLLRALGASRRIGREELAEAAQRPMLKSAYGGGIDTVGGTTLANLVKSTAVGGAVAACGLVGGADVPLTVFPFILRGVALLGVDTEHTPRPQRLATWERLAGPWRLREQLALPGMVREVALDELEGPIGEILEGRVTGRVVVRL